ncbi:MAG: hypothetical protein WDM88_05040 [Galbitalea sp.]
MVSFIVGIVQYAGIDDHTTTSLGGLDEFLGLPNAVWSVILFSIFVTWFIGAGRGARYRTDCTSAPSSRRAS